MRLVVLAGSSSGEGDNAWDNPAVWAFLAVVAMLLVFYEIWFRRCKRCGHWFTMSNIGSRKHGGHLQSKRRTCIAAHAAEPRGLAPVVATPATAGRDRRPHPPNSAGSRAGQVSRPRAWLCD